jgi:hypothetical protein
MGTSIRSWRKSFTVSLAVVVVSSTVATVAVAGSLAPSRRNAGDPVTFLRQVISEIAANNYAKAWRTLDPAQQRLVPEAEYVRCESLTPIPGELTSVLPVAVSEQRIKVAGVPSGPVPSQAVTFRLVIQSRALHASVVVVHTVHAVSNNGHWAWILPPPRLALHRAGCTDTRTRAYHQNVRAATT